MRDWHGWPLVPVDRASNTLIIPDKGPLPRIRHRYHLRYSNVNPNTQPEVALLNPIHQLADAVMHIRDAHIKAKNALSLIWMLILKDNQPFVVCLPDRPPSVEPHPVPLYAIRNLHTAHLAARGYLGLVRNVRLTRNSQYGTL